MKIQTDVNQRNHIHENFLSEVSRTIKIWNFDHQTWSDFVLYKNLVFFSKLNRFLDFGYLNDKSQPVSSLITMFLYVGVYCNIMFPLLCACQDFWIFNKNDGLTLCKNPMFRLYKINIGLVYNSLFCIFYLKTNNGRLLFI